MNSSQNSTPAPAGASRHPIDVITDIGTQLIFLRAMIGFASEAVDDAMTFTDTPRNFEREDDIVAAIAEIQRRTAEIENTVKAALAPHDCEVAA